MLIVAPKGSTKRAVRGETLFSSMTASMVSGSVAELELVENAVVRAVPRFLAYVMTFCFPMKWRRRGITIKPWINKPRMTVPA